MALRHASVSPLHLKYSCAVMNPFSMRYLESAVQLFSWEAGVLSESYQYCGEEGWVGFCPSSQRLYVGLA
jgi:hypothetical protein